MTQQIGILPTIQEGEGSCSDSSITDPGLCYESGGCTDSQYITKPTCVAASESWHWNVWTQGAYTCPHCVDNHLILATLVVDLTPLLRPGKVTCSGCDLPLRWVDDSGTLRLEKCTKQQSEASTGPPYDPPTN